MSKSAKLFGFFVACCTAASLSGSCWASNATINRCLKYKPMVIRESRYIAGMDAPYPVFLGQIEQESSCRAGVTSFDGGKGLMQATGDTINWLQETFRNKLSDISTVADPYEPRWAIRAMISYDCWLQDRVMCKNSYGALRSYNGGLALFNKEAARAKSCDQTKIEAQCRRKILTLKDGSKLDLCRVNCEYPVLVFQRAEHYR